MDSPWKVCKLCICLNFPYPSPGRRKEMCQERDHIECHNFFLPNSMQQVSQSTWECRSLLTGFWISHEGNLSICCCWVSVSMGDGSSGIFYSTILLMLLHQVKYFTNKKLLKEFKEDKDLNVLWLYMCKTANVDITKLMEQTCKHLIVHKKINLLIS